MKYAKIILLSLAALHSVAVSADYPVKPERTTQVVMSNTDVNRVVCDSGKITDIFYSEEKGIVVKTIGNDAFVKVKMKRRVPSGELIRPVLNVDLHIVCGGEVYTLIGSLKPVPSQTIRLKDGTGKIKKNIKLLGAMPEEKRIQWIMKKAYKNDYPPSFKVTSINEPFGDLNGMYLDKKREIRVEGMGLKLTEYEVAATVGQRVHESMFLQESFGKHIRAISMDTDSQNIDIGDKFRLFVLEGVINE